MRIPAMLLAAAVAASAAFGASATSWEMSTYQDFLRGRFQGVSLTRDGRLTVAPRMEALWASDQPVVWSMVRASDGAIYAATGHRGRVFKIDAAGKATLLWTAPQPEVFALALDPKGALFAATSPDGAVYRIENGKATEYFAPHAKYLWALATDARGVLYVGSGDQGRIFRVESAGKGEVYYETGQAHVTSLALDAQGRLLAGSEPNGILYRVTAKDKAFVLYDANLPEIRAIVPAADGSIYAAALGGSLARRAQAAQQASQTGAAGGASTPITTITVTADSQAGPDVKPPQPQDPAKQAQQQAAAAATSVTSQITPAVDVSGVEKSAVYRIYPDNTVETLWSSKEENVYDILPQGGQLLFSTDSNGRIYRMSPDRKVTLLAQTNESEATRLIAGSGTDVLASTGSIGKVYRLGDGPAGGGAATGSYEAPVHDAGSVARWGRLSWRASGPAVQFRTRTGNSLRPDNTWSEWSQPMSAAAQIASPNARYIQWKADLSGASLLDGVTVAYVPQNNAPVVKTISIFAVPAATQSAKASAAASPANTVYTVTVSDSGDATATASSGTPTQALSRTVAQQIQITWQADDPDGDRLVYTLHFRGEDEQEWKLIRANLRDNTYSLDGDVLADGKYFFRVTASDREVNPAASARDADLVSVPVLIDNTPPLVRLSAPRRTGAGVEVRVEAMDAASPLRRCEYSLDAATWVPLEAEDGVTDSPSESFVVRLGNVSAGEHVLVVRAADTANNMGLAKVVLR